MNLAGIAYDAEDAESDLCAVSDTFAYSENGAVRDTNEIYKSVLLPIARISEKQLNSLINIDAVEKVDSPSALRINTPFIANIDNASELIGTLGKIFLYMGIALAVFAALLLFNFISASIAQKNKEIAIAAAVAVAGTFVPVFLTARQKPVEAIRSLSVTTAAILLPPLPRSASFLPFPLAITSYY